MAREILLTKWEISISHFLRNGGPGFTLIFCHNDNDKGNETGLKIIFQKQFTPISLSLDLSELK